MPPLADRSQLLQGTLDMLVLRALLFGPQHGHGIAVAIERDSQEVLQIEHGSLYPALHRLLQRGWIEAEWGVTANKRRARFYRLTEAGHRQLHAETAKWRRVVEAVGRVLHPLGEES